MKSYGIPFAYEMYGRIYVEANSKEEAFEKAQEKLDNMTVKEMEENSEYLSDSEEIDEEGEIIDENGNIIEDDYEEELD